jgi:proprotein convertase subtilisin/kexin type 5
LSCTTSATNCITCDGSSQFRTLSGSSCICSNGYFDPGTGSPICVMCSNACATCNSNFSNCLTCAGTISTRLAAPSCACKAKFYDDGSSADCQSCHYSCRTCTNGLACLTCDLSKFRIFNLLNNFCACDIRYYNDGTN